MACCDACGAECFVDGVPPVPRCELHGPRWKLARNAPGTDVLIVRDGRVLLARRAIDPDRGRWELPGGFGDRGEHPADTAHREIREELAIDVRLTGVLGFYVAPHHEDSVLVTVYIGETDDDPSEADGEVAAWQWFASDALPAEHEMARGHRVRLDDWVKTLRGEVSASLGLDVG
ncbi:MAG: NUDIX hydrolase [Acidimicrobiia bacterium]